MASLTTERVLDLAMANQAVRHLREGCMGHAIGFFQTPVAGLAGIAGVQMAAHIIGGLEVVLFVGSQGQQWLHLPHAYELSMTEADGKHSRPARDPGLCVLE